MSIRPIPSDNIPETSFEDIETTFNGLDRFTVANKQSSPLSNGLAPPSTASSESTTFSNSKKVYSTHTESEDADDDEHFLSDFEEFQGKDYDNVFKTHFVEPSSAEPVDFSGNEENQVAEEKYRGLSQHFKNLNLDNRQLKGVPFRRSKALKQPKSMMDLQNESKPTQRSRRIQQLSNSRSASNLRIGSRLGSNEINYKKSMPTLSKYNAIREEEEDEDYLKEFEDDFQFEKSLLQPQFLNDQESASPPLKLSPTQYNIRNDDLLLTPQLHKRHSEWNTAGQLELFKERRKSAKGSRSSPSRTNITASHRLKTIKQEIDHNTPMKKGKMTYDPETLQWRGNEQALSKFRDIDLPDKKAIVITGKGRPLSSTSKSKNSKPSDMRAGSQQSGKIVGKMMFDQENLRWIRIGGEKEDPFSSVPDYISSLSSTDTLSKRKSALKRSHSQLLPSRDSFSSRLNSSATTRYHSLGAFAGNTEPTFNIDSKLLERFYHEENKWNRTVGGWFILGDAESESYIDEQKLPDHKNQSYMYEIRNMVISSARN